MEIKYTFSVKKSEKTGDMVIFFDDLYGAATVYNALRRTVEESEMPFVSLRNGMQNHIRLVGDNGKRQWNAYISKFVFDLGIVEGTHKYYFHIVNNEFVRRV